MLPLNLREISACRGQGGRRMLACAGSECPEGTDVEVAVPGTPGGSEPRRVLGDECLQDKQAPSAERG